MVLEELKQEQRLCIQLFYIQKKSYEEITQITQYSLKEVKSHLQNGRRNLKILLENRKKDHER
jgi:DNA-directed RNA polymerase specialized sigma24 family protein